MTSKTKVQDNCDTTRLERDKQHLKTLNQVTAPVIIIATYNSFNILNSIVTIMKLTETTVSLAWMTDSFILLHIYFRAKKAPSNDICDIVYHG